MGTILIKKWKLLNLENIKLSHEIYTQFKETVFKTIAKEIS